jgi:hypothetical protein
MWRGLVIGMWETLGIEATADPAAIRKAYAVMVRRYRPDTHPQEFSQLREAYELALHLARLGVIAAPVAQAIAVKQEQPSTSASTDATVFVRDASEPADQASVEAGAPVDQRAVVPSLIDQLALCLTESGELPAVALMREQVAALRTQTIDARLDYESDLLHALLSDALPPLALVLEGERLFCWAERGGGVVPLFDDYRARRLSSLLEMAREYAFARQCSSNQWIRALFDPSARLLGLGATL